MIKVPLLDLHAQFSQIESNVRNAIDRVLSTHQYIMGPEVVSLEEEVAAYVKCSFGIGVSSGSDALIMALMALKVGPGDEVITTPFTFFATVGAISRLGARPVFIDIDAKDFNMDMRAVYDAITERTKAIIPVHLFGQSADMEPLVGICKERGIAIVEDAAQAIGTEYQGKRSGTFGDIACFSFFPSKNLGAMGDGGLCTTQSDELSEALRVLRAHGSKPKYYHRVIGGNFRLDALQAAVLREKFKYLDQWTEARRRNAITYDQKILESQLAEFIQIPWRRPGDRHIFNQYNLRVTKRDELKNFLKAKDIESEIYYPVPMHLQECFSYLGYKAGSFPEAEKAANEVLAIPVYPELSQEQIDHVVNSMRLFYFN